MFVEPTTIEDHAAERRQFDQLRSQSNQNYSYGQRNNFFTYWPSRQEREEYLEMKPIDGNRMYGRTNEMVPLRIKRRENNVYNNGYNSGYNGGYYDNYESGYYGPSNYNNGYVQETGYDNYLNQFRSDLDY
jgi:hypothetical protein